MPRKGKDYWQFGRYRLYPIERILKRGQELVPIAQTTFKVLLQLVEKAGAIVHQEELAIPVWGGQLVGKGALRWHIQRLRLIFGPDSIENVRPAGYRFRVPVHRNYGISETATHPRLQPAFDQTDLHLASADFYLLAADNAAKAGLHHEAIVQGRKGLEIVRGLPENSERLQMELSLLSMIGVPLMAIEGYASRQVEETYGRISEICHQLDDSVLPVSALWGMWVFNHVRGRFERAKDISRRCLQIAERVQDPNLLVSALNARGFTLGHLGELDSAMRYLDRAIPLSSPLLQQSHPSLYLLDPRIACRCQSALIGVLLGHPDTAIQQINDAVHAAQQIGHNETYGLALVYAAWIHQLRRERTATAERSQAALILAKQQRLPQILLWGTMFNGWAKATSARLTEVDEALQGMRASLKMQHSAGAAVARTYFLGLLAAALVHIRHFEEALDVIEEALAEVEENHERMFEAELLRLKGQCLLQQGGGTASDQISAAAQACFQKSFQVAQGQNARLLQLRAVVSLIGTHRQARKQAGARRLLAELLAQLKEGRGMADIVEATALLSM